MTEALNIDALALQIGEAVREAAEAAGMTVAGHTSHSDSSYLIINGVTVRISSHRAYSSAPRTDISIIVRPPDGHPFGGCDASDDIWFSRCWSIEEEITFEAEVDFETQTVTETVERRVYWMPDQDELIDDLVARIAARASTLESEADD